MSTFNVRVFNLLSEECVAKVRYPDEGISKTVDVNRKECTDPIRIMGGNEPMEIWFEPAPTKEVYLQYFLPNERIGNGGSSYQGYANIQLGIKVEERNTWKLENRSANGAKQKPKRGDPTVNVTIGENETRGVIR
jgi:hypothetical protein